MRFAVISDIHGNLPALEAVLADIRKRGVDQILNCGDLCTSPLWPRETLELLDSIAAPTVRGNHDRWIAELTPDRMSPALIYTREALTPAQRTILGALPTTLRIGRDVFMCHGTPFDDYEYLLEENIDGRLCLARPDLVARRLEGIAAELVLCGHSHHAALSLAPGGQLVVNPGSVGCPVFADNPAVRQNDCRAPHARYAVVTKSAGRWSAEFVTLAYDWEAAAKQAERNGRHEWAEAYRTGNVMTLP